MAKFGKVLVVVLLICAVVSNLVLVDANVSKSMHLTWGAQHASIFGEDLHLVLDRDSGRTLWFDPTADFHNYTIHWNPTEIVWYVDSRPIRVFRNYENKGIAYPNKQGMRVFTSLWNADDWATRGGLVKTDWSGAPFRVSFHHFRARACKWNGEVSINECASNVPANWWTSPIHKQLSYAQTSQLNWVRKNYIIYDYCTDTKRFNGQMPPECHKTQF